MMLVPAWLILGDLAVQSPTFSLVLFGGNLPCIDMDVVSLVFREKNPVRSMYCLVEGHG